jgi:hypothetical protein
MTIAELTAFVETLTEGQAKPVQRFVWEVVFGMIAGGSVLLSEIGRQLEQGTALLAIEKRLSRQLGSDRWDARELQEADLELVSSRVGPETVVALDIGDITKPYAQAMEGLCEVWDGSQGTVSKGYWLVQVEAHQPTGQRFPLWLEAWSQATPAFVSENRVLREIVTLVADATGWRGLWVFDRGGDRERLLRVWAKTPLRYIVRCCGDRLVEVEGGRGEGERKPLRQLAATVPLPGRLAIRHRDRRGRWHTIGLRYGYCHFTWGGASYWLVVVRGLEEEPLWLWTNIPVPNLATAEQIVRAYLRRWSVEDAARLLKQEFRLERLRVASWKAVQRLVALVSLAYGFVCRIGRLRQRLVLQLLSLVRCFRRPRKVIAYHLRKGLALLWAGSLISRSLNFG